MGPSPAEIVRTLVAGRLPGLVHLAHRPGPYHVRHATDPEGRVLMLVSVVSDLAAELDPGADDDVAVVLDVLDLPPAPGAPSLGRAWVSGWAVPLRGAEARRGAADFAAVDPTGDLLDVGTRFRLHRFEVVEARLEGADSVRRVDPGEYAAAEPDPLHTIEPELLADLTDHHEAQVAAYLRGHLDLAGGRPRVVRLDRYGLVVAYGGPGDRRRARLAFPHPVADPAELSRLLHPMLCPRAAGARPAADGR
ncbi:Protein of unknown function [Micromonospora purpureochromogenes]|uniref:DUF2470 domain-containing protein n=1 Tax=Micromonospora purpureochromogenes TaxID=47872 RepID=A0A1C4X7K4_9ACTN|nr:DUF2470 domain-containing protein [Micromonospora purpureochromogenes]SCF04357.1 Protein of unknown function [Micromonospora purpureochromogenes]